MNVGDYIDIATKQIMVDKFDDAIINLKLAEEIEPTNPLIHMDLALAYKSNGNNELARKHFLILKNLHPGMAKVFLSTNPNVQKYFESI